MLSAKPHGYPVQLVFTRIQAASTLAWWLRWVRISYVQCCAAGQPNLKGTCVHLLLVLQMVGMQAQGVPSMQE